MAVNIGVVIALVNKRFAYEDDDDSARSPFNASNRAKIVSSSTAAGTSSSGQRQDGVAKSRVAADCDPSYPGLCIPSGWQVGDLDGKDVPHRRFQIVPPDPQTLATMSMALAVRTRLHCQGNRALPEQFRDRS